MSKHVSALALIFLIGFPSLQAMATESKESFDQLQPGSQPSIWSPAWQQGFYGETGSPHWEVTTDPEAPSKPHVLKQTGKATYGWLVHPTAQAKNGEVEASFKIDSGAEDPEAGLIWRFQDGKNYYYVRANILENNIVLYRMFKGKKEQIKSTDVPVSKGAWHRFRVTFTDANITVFYDQKEVLSARDKRIPGSGRAGLFTTADTISAFDDFRVQGK